MANLLSSSVELAFAKLTANSNVTPEYGKKVSMKSEFYWERVLFVKGKKNYASITNIKEGKLIDRQLNITGLQIKKADVNRNISQKFANILENDILKSPNIELSDILTKMKKIEDEIFESLNNGTTEYTKPMKAGDPSAYKNPMGEVRVKSVIAWNSIYPDKPIQIDDAINVLKLKGYKLEDLNYIKDIDEEIYNNIVEKIINNPEFKKNLDYIALPKSLDVVPEWMRPLIRSEEIVENNIKVFIKILNSIGLETLNITKDSMFFSNILEF